jgi:hypothetical protein
LYLYQTCLLCQEIPSTLSGCTSNQQYNVQPVLLQVHNVKRFWVLNPTSMAYSFAWEGLDAGSPGAAASPFQCSTMTGVLAPGKRYEMVFQYTPNEDKLQVCKSPLH